MDTTPIAAPTCSLPIVSTVNASPTVQTTAHEKPWKILAIRSWVVLLANQNITVDALNASRPVRKGAWREELLSAK
jgi:hypothetical protein